MENWLLTHHTQKLVTQFMTAILNVNWPVIKPTLNRCFTVDISIYSRMEVNLICLTFILICFHGQSLISADADPKIKHRQFVSKARADYIKVKMIRFWQLANTILCTYTYNYIPTFAYIRLLNNSYENEVTLTGQNPPLKCY